jgi:UrcA family protein
MNATHTTPHRNIRFHILACLALVGLAGLAGPKPVLAGDVDDIAPRKLTVSYADLNLSSAQAVQRLYFRIAAAATQVCAVPGDQSLRAWAQTRICTRSAIRHAVVAIQLPALKALYDAKIGEPEPVQVATR